MTSLAYIVCLLVLRPIFLIVIALNRNYDQTNDYGENEFSESLRQFEAMYNSRWHSKAQFMVMLTKSDLCIEKLKCVPFNKTVGHYDGPNEFKAVTEWIKQQFRKCS